MAQQRFIYIVLSAYPEASESSGHPLIAFGNEAAANHYVTSTSESARSFGLEPMIYNVQAVRLVEEGFGVGISPQNGQTSVKEFC